jgi:cytochrome P450
MPCDFDFFEKHYAPKHPDLADHMWEVVEHLLTSCPVAHSDASADVGGGNRSGVWIVTKYEDVFRILRDWQTFSSSYPWLAEAETFSARLGDRLPITSDPPLQREFRRLLDPFLAPQAVARHEPQVREIVTELIDGFIEDGHCDLVSQLSYLHPPRMLYRVLFGIEDQIQLQRSLHYTKELRAAPDAATTAKALSAWMVWVDEFIEERRSSPRRSDIIDALLHGSIQGHPLTDEQIAGAIRLLINGGFFTTNDATSAAMLILIEHPDVQEQLRENPNLIPQLFDETLRLEPPVVTVFRVCTRDVELRGQKLKRGDAVLIHYGGANRDPEEFDHAAEMQFQRRPNRHLAFGAGPHRCIGSHVARLNLRIIFEEILSRMHNIRITEGKLPRQASPSLGRGLEYLPISFTPGKKIRP